jgi:hypothetical protein
VRREGTEYYGRREDEASKTTWEKRRPSCAQCRLPWPSSSSSSSTLSHIAACRGEGGSGAVVCRGGGPCRRVERWSANAEVKASWVRGEGDSISRRNTGREEAGS